MNINRYEPRSLIGQLQNDINRMFSNFGWAPGDGDIVGSNWAPAVDIKEDDKQFCIRADLPGVEPKDIEVTMDHGALTIRGKRASEKKEEKDGWLRTERFSGEFYRRLMLPDTADAEHVDASTEKGVLEITIPKRPAAQAKRVEVKTQAKT
ncbi:MAG: Hsp20/alpha crystallin family protein [Nevskia sp.]|nr:Hsp20/alpha crystallin family protein [Nevskia sp.]